jgi:hypothetical protein
MTIEALIYTQSISYIIILDHIEEREFADRSSAVR